MTASAFDHIGLSVRDLDLERAFYGAAFGLVEIVEEVDIPAAQVRTAILRSATGLKLELIERSGSRQREFVDAFDAAGTQGYGHWALDVEDVDAVFARLLAAGATAVSEPAPAMRAGARFAYVKDPEGNLIELIDEGR